MFFEVIRKLNVYQNNFSRYTGVELFCYSITLILLLSKYHTFQKKLILFNFLNNELSVFKPGFQAFNKLCF